MKFSAPFLAVSALLLVPFVSAAACNADNCLRALRGRSVTASASCNAFEATPTLPVPTYATACSGTARYSSACSCLLASTSSTTATSTKSSSMKTSTTTPGSSSSSSSKSSTTTTGKCTSAASATTTTPPSPTFICSEQGLINVSPYPQIGSTLVADDVDTCAEFCLNTAGCLSFQNGPEEVGSCLLFSKSLQGLNLIDIGISYAPPIYDISCFTYAC